MDGQFWSAPDCCESYGRDMVTGAPVSPTEYRALNHEAKAVIKAVQPRAHVCDFQNDKKAG